MQIIEEKPDGEGSPSRETKSKASGPKGLESARKPPRPQTENEQPTRHQQTTDRTDKPPERRENTTRKGKSVQPSLATLENKENHTKTI